MTAKKRDKGGKFTKATAVVEEPRGAEEAKPEWEITTWTPDLIKQWSADPEFRSFCKASGFVIEGGVSEMKTTSSPGDIDVSSLASVIAEAMARVNAQQQLPTVPGSSTGDLIEFPDSIPVDAIGPQGKKFVIDMPLYPINIAGEDYSGSGYYDPNVTERLTEEISDARFVKIPYNAAFVEYVFHRTNAKGRIEKVKEMFTGPGVFAGRTLAASIESQLKTLVEYTLPGGPDAPLIPGTKTQYNDMRTNGLLFVPGYTYKLPQHVADDLARRVAEHAASFQRVHQERQSLGRQGLSIYSGVQLEADQAQARKDAGMRPDQIDKVVREGRI